MCKQRDGVECVSFYNNHGIDKTYFHYVQLLEYQYELETETDDPFYTRDVRTVLSNENLTNVHINKWKFQCRDPFESCCIQSHNSHILKRL